MFWVLVGSHVPIVLSLKAHQGFLSGLGEDLRLCACAVESRGERERVSVCVMWRWRQEGARVPALLMFLEG